VVLEPGSEVAAAAWSSADRVTAAAIGYVELRAAIAAAQRDVRIPTGDEPAVWTEIETVWAGITDIRLDTSLLRAAGQLAQVHRLRAYDAVHLAALVAVEGPAAVQLGCWDVELRRAAGDMGYELIPPRIEATR